ncbi:uncharacterized protein BDR25DRAFT_355940 [Lindgomyces ingoldianus]|uniref:Uncharacterized protein n=1 Tax=Lindgomyces ingoldianus TaxID=673940 RepID=A0ACB6QUR6_9PLEO|nr:uncharacterized protein BDR25DRAFT_355940 [Lindgomyces ingoldianus]KAF2470245.1 hypothetical protein BDR25DRAFT_355940 [Lindgomyces ingoldianus]
MVSSTDSTESKLSEKDRSVFFACQDSCLYTKHRSYDLQTGQVRPYWPVLGHPALQ